MSVTVACRFPTPCWYARNVQAIARNSNAGKISMVQTENVFQTKLRQRQDERKPTEKGSSIVLRS